MNVCVYIEKSYILQLPFCIDMIQVKNIHAFMLTKVIKYSRVKYADRKRVFPISQGFFAIIQQRSCMVQILE